MNDTEREKEGIYWEYNDGILKKISNIEWKVFTKFPNGEDFYLVISFFILMLYNVRGAQNTRFSRGQIIFQTGLILIEPDWGSVGGHETEIGNDAGKRWSVAVKASCVCVCVCTAA